ncbi:SPOR domain-containing protein [Devosia sp. YR412]|uniref:SPOR domain-containing protein n=1 Tax=Devosia sp. YR412 TaxID=1881030 RepID=UPI00147D160A|nr:SPOR domain-containing protein [Devosia sp. YR412]
MAGQSDASDDLIAELAKLMAQDARGDKPAEPSSPLSPIRIPGGDISAPPPPRFDFGRSSPVPAAVVQDKPAPVPAAPASVAAAPDEVEPFRFDFGLVSPKAPEPTPRREEPVHTPVAGPSSPVNRAPDPGFTPVDHDSIADLIAAELAGGQSDADEHQAEAVPVAPAPQPEPAPVIAEQRPAPQPSSNWAPTAVAASLGAAQRPAQPAMRPLNLQPAQRPEQDRFKVAPVFGLGSGQAEPSVAPVVSAPVVAAPVQAAPTRSEPTLDWRQPAAQSDPSVRDDDIGRDPIDEIESLIGRAVRVDLDRQVQPAFENQKPVSPAPSLRSLATPVLPTPSAAPPPSPRSLSGADEAILAAAEAAGVNIGWVDNPEVVEQEPVAPRHRRAPRVAGMTRALAGPLVAVTLLLAAGFGLYWVLGLGREPGPAPLLTADASPTKETPVVDPEAAPAQSVVFNEIDGVVPGAEEQLVSRDQADVSEVTQVPAAVETSEEGLANRRVRTVTVRPDGTIVSGEDSVAGSNILPVARPNVPAVPGAETASEELLASAQPAAPTSTATTPLAAATPTPATAAVPEPTTPAVTPVSAGETVPAVDLSGNPLAGKTTVIPRTRPAGLSGPGIASVSAAASPVNAVVSSGSASGNMLPPPPTNSAFGNTTSAAAAPAQTAAAPAAQPSAPLAQPVEVEALGNTAPAYVQLASQRSEAEARSTAQSMVTRFGPLFNGANLEVQRVDLGERGIYYRVRVPANSMQDANGICTNVKAAGGDCFTM